MKLLRQLSCMMMLLTLFNCGGGSGGSLSRDDTGVDTPPESEILYAITLSKSDGILALDNSISITAHVTADGVALAGQLVEFTIDNAGLANLFPATGTVETLSNGEAVLQLNSGTTAGGGIITATINNLDISAFISFTSSGDGSTDGEISVAELSLFASSQQIASSGSQEIDLIAIAKDSNNNLLEGVDVTFTATSGQIEVVNAVTGTDGKASAKLKTDNEPMNRIITANANSDSILDNIDIQVVGTTIQLTGSSSLAINDDTNYIVTLLDSDGNGIANTPVALSLLGASSGSVADITIVDTVTTDFTGKATVIVRGTSGGSNTILASALGALNGTATVTLSSADAGRAIVTFTGTDGSVELNNQFEFEFIAENASSLIAQASPSSIGPNGQQSTISVVVKDANANLVKNKVIDFTLTDTNGGEIFPATAVTDSNGSASTVYTSNAVSSQDGVEIMGTVRDNGISDNVFLTVADREVFISLGTGNDIEETDVTTYNKQYAVFVTDIESTPVEGASLTVSAIPRTYYKGNWFPIYDEFGDFIVWEARGLFIDDIKHPCSNEDINLDGVLDIGEDINGNGELTPGNVVAALGNVVTDENGGAIIDIRYPQSYGAWVDVDLIVSTRVNGTESSKKVTFTLPVSANDVNREDITPPTASIGLTGPFGELANCSVEN